MVYRTVGSVSVCTRGPRALLRRVKREFWVVAGRGETISSELN
jgi:hypothetical protein